MKQTIGLYEFRRAFEDCRPNNFSYEGQGLLFEYFEELEESCGEDIELDVISICCEYSEDTWQSIVSNYSIELPDRDDGLDDEEYEEECKDAVRDYLQDETSLVGETDEGFIYANF